MHKGCDISIGYIGSIPLQPKKGKRCTEINVSMSPL